MANNTVGQINCPNCNRVAEIRRRANGQKLPFMVCKKCGQTQTKNEDLREFWLQNMVSDGELGEYGQIIESTSNKPNNVAALENHPNFKRTSNEWTPPDELKPENIEPTSNDEPTAKPDTAREKSKNWGWALKIGIGFVAFGAAAFGAGKLSNTFSNGGK